MSHNYLLKQVLKVLALGTLLILFAGPVLALCLSVVLAKLGQTSMPALNDVLATQGWLATLMGAAMTAAVVGQEGRRIASTKRSSGEAFGKAVDWAIVFLDEAIAKPEELRNDYLRDSVNALGWALDLAKGDPLFLDVNALLRVRKAHEWCRDELEHGAGSTRSSSRRPSLEDTVADLKRVQKALQGYGA